MLSTRQEARILGGQHPRIYWPPQGSDFVSDLLREAGGQGLSLGGQLGSSCDPSLHAASVGTIKDHPPQLQWCLSSA